MNHNLNEFIEGFKLSHPMAELSFGASSILFYDGGIIFSLVKQKNWRINSKGVQEIDFSGIGGAIEKNETPIQALIREIKEEIGLSKDDIVIVDAKKTLLIRNGAAASRNLRQAEERPAFIFEIKIPKNKLRPGQPEESYLILFVYLVKLKSPGFPEITEEEEIPGLLHIDGSKLENNLSKIKFSKNRLVRNGVKLFIRKKFLTEFDSEFELRPKFTPICILQSKLSFEELINMGE